MAGIWVYHGSNPGDPNEEYYPQPVVSQSSRSRHTSDSGPSHLRAVSTGQPQHPFPPFTPGATRSNQPRFPTAASGYGGNFSPPSPIEYPYHDVTRQYHPPNVRTEQGFAYPHHYGQQNLQQLNLQSPTIRSTGMYPPDHYQQDPWNDGQQQPITANQYQRQQQVPGQGQQLPPHPQRMRTSSRISQVSAPPAEQTAQQHQLPRMSYPSQESSMQPVELDVSFSSTGTSDRTQEQFNLQNSQQQLRSEQPSLNTSQYSALPAEETLKPRYNDKQIKKILEVEKIFNETKDFYEDIGIKTFRCPINNCYVEYKYIAKENKEMTCHKCIKARKSIKCPICVVTKKKNGNSEDVSTDEENANSVGGSTDKGNAYSVGIKTDEKFIIDHCVVNHPDKMAFCYICGEKMNLSELKNHRREKRCEGKYQCTPCRISFKCAIELVDHKYKKHPKQGLKWKCAACNRDFASAAELFNPVINRCKGQTMYLWECLQPGCYAICENENKILEHIKKKNLLETEIGAPMKTEEDILTGLTNEFFEDVGIETYCCEGWKCLKPHRYIDGKNQMICYECENTEIKCKKCPESIKLDADTPKNYADHCQEKHNSSAPCYLCDAEATSDNILDHFQQNKCGRKYFQCLECSKSFKHELLLVNHRYGAHKIGERKWICKKCRCDVPKLEDCGTCKENTEHEAECQHDGCKESCKTNIEMLRHMKTETQTQQMEVDLVPEVATASVSGQ